MAADKVEKKAEKKVVAVKKNKGRILLAEDSPDAQQLIVKHLTKSGFEVDAAGDGEECVQKFLNSEYNLVIVDFVMPKRNGIEVLQEIRKHRSSEDLPVLIITSKQEKSLIVEAVKLGVNDFMVKPIRSSDLVARVERHLIELTTEEVREFLMKVSVADASSLTPLIRDNLAKHHLNAYPFDYHGVKFCLLLPIGKNPRIEAKQELMVLLEDVTVMAKGSFVWNVIWPRVENRGPVVSRAILNQDGDAWQEIVML